MSFRLVHFPDGVVMAMREPDYTDDSAAVPRQMQRLTKRAKHVRTVSDIVPFAEPRERRYGPVSLLDKKHYHCAWIGPDGLCCGQQTDPGKSWCPYHGDIVWGRVPKLEAAE